MRTVKNFLGVSRFELKPELFKGLADIFEVKVPAHVPVFYPKLDMTDERVKKVDELYGQFGYRAHAGIVPYDTQEKLYGYTLTRIYDREDLESYQWGCVYSENSAMMCRSSPTGGLLLDEIDGSVNDDLLILTARGHFIVSQRVRDHLDGNGVNDLDWGDAKAYRHEKAIKGSVKLFHLRPTHVFPKLSVRDNRYFNFKGESVEWGNAEGFSVSRGEYTLPIYVYKKNVLNEVKDWDCALMYETLGFNVKFRPTFFSVRVIGLLYDLGCKFNWGPLCFK